MSTALKHYETGQINLTELIGRHAPAGYEPGIDPLLAATLIQIIDRDEPDPEARHGLLDQVLTMQGSIEVRSAAARLVARTPRWACG